MSTPDAMMDIETLSSLPTAAVVSIGAQAFNLRTGEIGNKFYVILDTNFQDRHIDSETMAWWSQQSKEARAVLHEAETSGQDPYVSLKAFYNWCKENGIKHIWGNGNMFDNIIIRNICRQYDVRYPVHYRCDYDMRTLMYIYGKRVQILREGTHHNALDDAIYQAKVVIEAHKGIKNASR